MFDEKTVLIIGGTGSLGQELTRELLKTEVRSIRIFSRGEYLQAKMRETFHNERLRFLIGDVRDKGRLSRAMNYADMVIHCAALKRIETCEYNPLEACRTNIGGAENVVDAAIDTGIEKVLAISSDKAVHPISVYGTTKQAMEKIIIGGNIYGDTLFSCIRSGNFRTSRGNVLELWKDQIRTTGEITVTDMDMGRFWIDLNDIAKLVIRCLDTMEGNEIFIPKMQNELVSDLVAKLGSDIKIKLIGHRPGEKLNELLFNEGEEPIDKGDYWLIKVKQAGGNI